MARSTRSIAALTGTFAGAVGLGCVGVFVYPQIASGQTAAQTAGAQTTSATTHHASNGRTATAAATPQPVITLERSECHGQCAEYRLAFYEDGQVVYEGVANVSKAGRWYARVPRETVAGLVGDFRRMGYDSLTAKYPPGLTASPSRDDIAARRETRSKSSRTKRSHRSRRPHWRPRGPHRRSRPVGGLGEVARARGPGSGAGR